MNNDNLQHKKIAFSIFLIVICSSCSVHKTNKIPKRVRNLKNLTIIPVGVKPVYHISFNKDEVYGSTKKIMLVRNVHITVDDSGRVFISDRQQNTIHVFKPNSTFIMDIGRKGKGPGEFQNIQDMKIHNAHLYVLDNRLLKISVFDLNTFQFITSYNLSLEDRQNVPLWWERTRKKGLVYQPNYIYIRPDGSFLILFNDNQVGRANNLKGRTYEATIFNPEQNKYINTKHDLLSFRWKGQVLVHKENNGMIVMFGVPYKPGSKFDFNNGTFVVGWSEKMLFKFYNKKLSYQRALYHSYTNVPLHLKDVLTYYKKAPQSIIRAIKSDNLPKKWPAFNSLKLDNKGRLWVSMIVKNFKFYKWWILSQKGKLLARFNWPRNKPIQVIKNGYIYTKEKNKNGLECIVRYKITMK
jgi:hypothetical protein